MSRYTGDYSKHIMPYGSGSTRGMGQMHYEAIADTLRKTLESVDSDFSSANDRAVAKEQTRAIILRLGRKFEDTNSRFRLQTFLNAATNAAYGNPTSPDYKDETDKS